MSSANPKPSTTPTSPPQRAGRLALFGPPPLLEGEDTAAYDELLVQISGAVKPADILEEIWVRGHRRPCLGGFPLAPAYDGGRA